MDQVGTGVHYLRPVVRGPAALFQVPRLDRSRMRNTQTLEKRRRSSDKRSVNCNADNFPPA